MKKERRISDIEDCWGKDNEPDKFIKEGDVVLLHSWGDDENQIIGVAVLVWDTEYHGWDYSMIAGDYVDSEYDRWRQSPRIIGYKTKDDNDFFYREFDYLTITDEEFKEWQGKWDELIKLSKLESDKKWQIKEKKALLRNSKKKQEELQKELDEVKKNLKTTEEEIKSIRKGDGE